MTQVIVNIVGGTQKENTTAVTIANRRWGQNGAANFGQQLEVNSGTYDLCVFKTTNPRVILADVDIAGNDVLTLNITVNNDSIVVN